jgi:hypothetical protein
MFKLTQKLAMKRVALDFDENNNEINNEVTLYFSI